MPVVAIHSALAMVLRLWPVEALQGE
jgi:hypothetical protein